MFKLLQYLPFGLTNIPSTTKGKPTDPYALGTGPTIQQFYKDREEPEGYDLGIVVVPNFPIFTC